MPVGLCSTKEEEEEEEEFLFIGAVEGRPLDPLNPLPPLLDLSHRLESVVLDDKSSELLLLLSF